MAVMSVNLPDDFIGNIARMGDSFDEIAEEILDAGIVPLAMEIRKNLSRHKRTGELLKALKVKSSRKYQGVWRKTLTFDGSVKGKSYNRVKRSGKVVQEEYRNFQKALALEYGTSNQPATPVIRPAVLASEKKVSDNMQQALNQEVDKL
jgi:HK97 gp10 family phage protein